MKERRRPLGIWVIVVIQLVNGGVTLVDAVLGQDLLLAGAREVLTTSPEGRAIVIVWSVLAILASVSLWRLSRRGWVAMMVLVGIALAAHLVLWWFHADQMQWLRLAFCVAAAFYLNSREVQGLFLQRHEVERISLGGRGATE